MLGQGSDHCRNGSFFKVGWRLDVRGKVLDDPADLAVLVNDGLAGAATGETAAEVGTLGGRQIAPYEVEGVRMGQLDIALRKHRRYLAG